MVLYPLSAFRAMSRAAEQVYGSILRNGDQKAEVDSMQTRAQLYEVLGYHAYEEKLDALFSVGAGPAVGAASEVGAGHAVGAGPAREPGQ